jgi:hypothetical protein
VVVFQWNSINKNERPRIREREYKRYKRLLKARTNLSDEDIDLNSISELIIA